MSQETKLINLEAEQALLGALLNDSTAFDGICSLDPGDFEFEMHFHIFFSIMRCATAGNPFDMISVLEYAKSKGDQVVTYDYLQMLCNRSLSSANVALHAKIIRDLSLRRKIARLGYSFTLMAELSDSFEECYNEALSHIEALSKDMGQDEIETLPNLMLGIFETMQNRATGKHKRLSTGLKDVDRKTSGGFDRGELIILAGRPAMGKTGLALSIAKNMSKDYSCLFFSMEMPKEQIRDRFTAMLGNIPLSFVIDPTEESTETNKDDWASVVRAQKESEKLNFYIDDKSSRSLLDIRLKAKEVKRKFGLDVIFVDYLGLMSGGDKAMNRVQQVGSYSRGLKALAKDLNVSIVCLAQLNRGLEERPDKRPMMSDLRDSGEIEQDADMVFMLYRDEVYHPETTDQKNIAELIIRKQRQGVTGTIPLAYIGNQTRFDTLESQWQPPSYSKQKPASRGFD